jgi:DNA-binding LacI/PurR family transcriptional regulator
LVLNNRLDSRVPISAKTRQNVLEAARQLGYEPNDIARSLRSGASLTIGFLMPTMQNPHYWDILEGAEEEITAHGYHLSLVVANLNPERELDCLRSLSQQRLDGLILIPTFLDTIAGAQGDQWASRTPVVITHPVEAGDWVFPDFRSGDEQMLDHLLALGHRRIGLIDGGARSDLTLARQAMYREKIAATGIPLDERLIYRCKHLTCDGYLAAIQLLDLPQPPTAIWTINDLLAVGVLRALHERGLCVPDEMALAGYDDIPLAGQLSPPLTTVHIPARQLGRRAAEILFRRLENPSAEPVQEVLPTRLVIRQSTCKLQSPTPSQPGEAGRKGGEPIQV